MFIFKNQKLATQVEAVQHQLENSNAHNQSLVKQLEERERRIRELEEKNEASSACTS